MSDLSQCPNPKCNRQAEDNFSSNWFPVHTCRDCDTKYCDDCGAGGGTTCPECGSSDYSDYDKVYAD